MEVEISREFIKPSLLEIRHKNPHKLNIFDQIFPEIYTPIILFFSMDTSKFHSTQILTHLKKSLSETLNLYYPLSGRLNDEYLFIHRFEEGIPFFETEVNCSMSDYLKLHQIESLNIFLPCNPFCKEPHMGIPLLAIQATKFTCGSIALGFSFSHKLLDTTTFSNFITSWSSLHREDFDGVIEPELDQPSLIFPQKKPFPRIQSSQVEKLCSSEANYITRRFLFDAKTIATLKAKAKGNQDNQMTDGPTRIETLSGFIWKYFMEATTTSLTQSSSSLMPSILLEMINLRGRTKPPMKKGCIGNLLWFAIAISNPNDTKKELHELASMVKEAIGIYKTDFTYSLQGEEKGFEDVCKFLDNLEGLISMENQDVIVFTSWCHMNFTKVNFGWGEPCWVGVMGKVGNSARNMVIFIDAKDGKGIEAWITLDEKRMEKLQKNPEFLAFASPDPRVSSL